MKIRTCVSSFLFFSFKDLFSVYKHPQLYLPTVEKENMSDFGLGIKKGGFKHVKNI
jgi:hypothetical protein